MSLASAVSLSPRRPATAPRTECPLCWGEDLEYVALVPFCWALADYGGRCPAAPPPASSLAIGTIEDDGFASNPATGPWKQAVLSFLASFAATPADWYVLDHPTTTVRGPSRRSRSLAAHWWNRHCRAVPRCAEVIPPSVGAPPDLHTFSLIAPGWAKRGHARTSACTARSTPHPRTRTATSRAARGPPRRDPSNERLAPTARHRSRRGGGKGSDTDRQRRASAWRAHPSSKCAGQFGSVRRVVAREEQKEGEGSACRRLRAADTRRAAGQRRPCAPYFNPWQADVHPPPSPTP